MGGAVLQAATESGVYVEFRASEAAKPPQAVPKTATPTAPEAQTAALTPPAAPTLGVTEALEHWKARFWDLRARSLDTPATTAGGDPPQAVPKTATPTAPEAQTAALTPPAAPTLAVTEGEIYDRIMTWVLSRKITYTYGSSTVEGKKMPYRSYEKNKTIAVCINWESSSHERIVTNGFTFTHKYWKKSESKRKAILRCKQRYEKKHGCTCQVFDQNDENVLEVPDEFLARYMGTQP